jgi:hypothetical protein
MDLKEGSGVRARSVESRYGPMASGCCVHEDAVSHGVILCSIHASFGEHIVLLARIY